VYEATYLRCNLCRAECIRPSYNSRRTCTQHIAVQRRFGFCKLCLIFFRPRVDHVRPGSTMADGGRRRPKKQTKMTPINRKTQKMPQNKVRRRIVVPQSGATIRRHGCNDACGTWSLHWLWLAFDLPFAPRWWRWWWWWQWL